MGSSAGPPVPPRTGFAGRDDSRRDGPENDPAPGLEEGAEPIGERGPPIDGSQPLPGRLER